MPRSRMTLTEIIESPMSNQSTQPAPCKVKERSLSAIILILLGEGLRERCQRALSANHLHGADQPADAAAAVARDDPDPHRTGLRGSGEIDFRLRGRRAQRFDP